MADQKPPKITSVEEACEIIELTSRELDTLAKAFDLITELCSDGATINKSTFSEPELIH